MIEENRPEYDTGDFLMRGLLGLDEASGALALGDTVRVGQTLRSRAGDVTLMEKLHEVFQRARGAHPLAGG